MKEYTEMIGLAFILELKDRFIKLAIFDLSAQLAYYFLISFFPWVLVLVTLVGYLPLTSLDVLYIVHSYMPSLSDKVLRANLESILDRERAGLFSVSLIATVYLASLGFHSLIRVLDSVYKVEKSRTLWKEWVVGIILMLGLLLGLVLSLVFTIFGDVLGDMLAQFFHISDSIRIFWNTARWCISSAVLIVLFMCLYVFAPNVRVRVKEAIWGAVFATFAWQASSLLFAYYIQFVDYSYLYGNLGSAIILIGWFYWSSFVLIVGGCINAILREMN